MIVFNNFHHLRLLLPLGVEGCRGNYVEVTVNAAHLRSQGKNVIGWSVSPRVFGQSSRFDDLVGAGKNFLHEGEALDYADTLAKRFDLERDEDLQGRKALWAV